MSSIREIARQTGYSIATVSRVFNQPEAVSKQARTAIEAAANHYGYHPHPAARALATRRTRIIGAAIPGIEHSIFTRFIKSLECNLQQESYSLVLSTTGNNREIELERCTDLIRMGAEGIVVSGLDHLPELLILCRRAGIPLLCTSTFDEHTTALPTIGYDNFALAATAANYLKTLGHKKIGVIHGPLHNNDRTMLRVQGIRTIIPDAYLVETAISVQDGCKAFALLEQHAVPFSAVFCLSDVLAQGVCFEALRRGYQIPDTLSIMGFDDLDWAQWMTPSLTTIHLPVEEMGHDAALALVRHLEDGQSIQSRCLTGHIVIRESTAATATSPAVAISIPNGSFHAG